MHSVELARLQVVAWDQPNTAMTAVYFGLPPAIVLMAEHGQVISLGEA